MMSYSKNVQVVVTKSASDFSLMLDWMRFRQGVAATVRNAEEHRRALDNGVRSYYRVPDLAQERDTACLQEASVIEISLQAVPQISHYVNAAAILVRIPYGQRHLNDLLLKYDERTQAFKNKAVLLIDLDRQVSKQDYAAIYGQAKALASKVVLRSSTEQENSLIDSLSDGFSFLRFDPPDEVVIGCILRTHKLRISVLEATTGGLVAAALMAVPGASAFFISGATVYTGRGAKRILPPAVLEASALFDRQNNYSSQENYEASKRKYCDIVSQKMREAMKADVCVVESGTAGPDFYIPNVEAFTAAGVALPDGSTVVDIFHNSERDRRRNMEDFKRFTLRTLRNALEEYVAKSSKSDARL